MLAARHEEYTDYMKMPFILHIDLERTRYKNSKEKNWHKDIEIQLCTKGSGKVLINGEAYDFNEGNIAVINSDFIHYTGTERELTYTCLIISAEFCSLVGINYNELLFEPIVTSEKIAAFINELISVYSNENEAFKIPKCTGVILKILIELSERHSTKNSMKITANKSFDKIKEVIEYIKKNYNKKITLDALAEYMHMDKFTLCHNFKKATSQTIIQYINNYRCQIAIGFIGKGRSVTETAALCGFETASFFSKTFKKYIGVLPSKYNQNTKN